MNRSIWRTAYWVFSGICAMSAVQDCAAISISSVPPAVYSGVEAAPNQVFQVTATGTVDLAITGGPYVTDADGTIIVAPPLDDPFWTNERPDIGVPASIGGFKIIGPTTDGAPLPNGRYGLLVAGFAPSPTPTSYADFIGGFTAIGLAGSVTAPPSGGHLFFAVNDIFGYMDRPDNAGAFEVTVVPEPATSALVGAALVTVLWGRRLRLRI
jgi:hypothetical protein